MFRTAMESRDDLLTTDMLQIKIIEDYEVGKLASRKLALSSTEAEYMAISEATKEAMYLPSLLEKVGWPCDCVTLLNDNQGTIRLAESDSFHARTKHIDVRHHFIREVCNVGIIHLK